MGMQHLLFPIDFSPQCGAIAPYVATLAKAFVARLTVMHVMDTGGGISDFTPFEHHFHTIREELRGRLDSYCLDLFQSLNVDRVFKIGRPVEEIVAHAAATDAGLIIMPTHGHTRFRELLLGSITAGVLHDTASSVLTSAHMDQSAPPAALPASILCAIDLSLSSIDVLAMSAHVAEYSGASVRVVHILPPGASGLTEEHAAAIYRERAAAAGVDIPFSAIRAESIADAIIDAERLYSADLLVIGRGKLQGVLGRLRSGAHELIRRSRCPVLSV